MKKTILIILSINLLFSCRQVTTNSKKENLNTPKAKIAGVVTYYFNDNLRYVPDVGANVYIALKSDIKNKDIETLQLTEFTNVCEFRNMWQDYKRSGSKPDNDFMKTIYQYKIDDTAHFNSYDRKCFEQFLKIKNASKINRVVDANGNFSVEVDTGEYYVLIKSAHRIANSLCEVNGKPFFKWVILKPNEEVNISPKFSEFE